jgi:hypothetical protein
VTGGLIGIIVFVVGLLNKKVGWTIDQFPFTEAPNPLFVLGIPLL